MAKIKGWYLNRRYKEYTEWANERMPPEKPLFILVQRIGGSADSTGRLIQINRKAVGWRADLVDLNYKRLKPLLSGRTRKETESAVVKYMKSHPRG